MTQLGRPEREVWLMPLGALLDQWEVYKQFQGVSKSAKEHFVDNLIPEVI